MQRASSPTDLGPGSNEPPARKRRRFSFRGTPGIAAAVAGAHLDGFSAGEADQRVMKLRRFPKHRPKPDRWAAFDSLPALVRQALAQATHPLDPLKLLDASGVDDAMRRIARLDAAAGRRANRVG